MQANPLRLCDYDIDPPMLIIKGIRFGETAAGASPHSGCRMGFLELLTIKNWAPREITAELPASVVPGDYKLIVFTGSNKVDRMGVTIGEVRVS